MADKIKLIALILILSCIGAQAQIIIPPGGSGSGGSGSGATAISDVVDVSVSTATNPSSETQLKQLTLAAGSLNATGRKFEYISVGRYTTNAGQTPTLRYRLYLCTVSGCGSGTVLTLADFTTAATTASTTNSWRLETWVGTAATGATGTVESRHALYVQLGAAGNLSPESRQDQNNAVSATIDMTGQLFLRLTVLMSSADAGNSVSSRMAWVAYGGAVTSFDKITSGNNATASMIVDSGATLDFNASGVINANRFKGNATVAVPDGGTGLTSGTSGGVPYFNSGSTMASSAALTANLPVIGGGAGAAPAVGTRSGNTTQYVTTTGAQTSGDCVKIDANGNHVANGSACGSGGGSGTINSGVTNIIPKYIAATTVDDSLFSDDGTTGTYTGSGGFSASGFTSTGAGAGFASLQDGSSNYVLIITASSGVNGCQDAGANDTYACNITDGTNNLQAYVTGMPYRFKANTANTGAATINFNSLGAKTIKKVAGGITTDLADNDIRAGQWVDLVYDGTNMQCSACSGNAPAGGGISTNRVSVTASSGTSMNNTTLTAINWDTETYDDGGLHDNVTNNTRLTAPSTGSYAITCSAGPDAGSNNLYVLGIKLNGTTYIAYSQVNTANMFASMSVSAIHKMAATDYVECIGAQASGGSLAVGGSGTSRFDMAQVTN